MDKNRPIPRALLIGMFVGTALLAYLAGVLTVNHSTPATWEECMVRDLQNAHTSESVVVLSRYCATYPRRKRQAAAPAAGPWQKYDPQSAASAN